MTTTSPDARPSRVPRSIARQILDALTEAASGTGLAVIGSPDLEGASIRGPRVEAYIYASSGGALAIDLWRHEASDPYAILRSNDLQEAARYAVIHASGQLPARQALPPHTPPTIWYAPSPQPPARNITNDSGYGTDPARPGTDGGEPSRSHSTPVQPELLSHVRGLPPAG